MKANVYTEYGSPDVLRFIDVEKPAPAHDEVLVRVRAASVNALDWHLMRGKPWFARLGRRRFTSFVARITLADLESLKDLLEARTIVPVIHRRYPLSEAADAIRYLETGHARGKVVVTMEP